MAYNLEYTIHLTDADAEKYGVSGKTVPARAAVPSDIDSAKSLSETLIAHAGGTKGKIFETSETSMSHGSGQLVAS